MHRMESNVLFFLRNLLLYFGTPIKCFARYFCLLVCPFQTHIALFFHRYCLNVNELFFLLLILKKKTKLRRMSSRMVPLFNSIQFSTRDAEGFLCNLHQKYVRLFFIVSFSFSIARQLVGDNIICQATKQDIDQNLLETVCFINGTFSKDDEGNIFHHPYYQWISTVFLLEALSFSFPFTIWNKYYGFYVSELKHVKSDESYRKVVRMIEDTNGNNIFYAILGLEWVYSVHLVVQGGLLNAFFNNAFSYPWNLKALQTVFPDYGSCWFTYFSGGFATTGRFYCALPLNALYRKIFFVVLFGFWLLLFFQIFYLTFQTVLAIRRKNIDRYKSYDIAANHADTYEMRIALQKRRPIIRSSSTVV